MMISITKDMVSEAIERARRQESIYGHNTGHFTLESEKENTIIGTLGEIVARRALLEVLVGRSPAVEISLTNFGAAVDLELKSLPGIEGIHVKTGLWKKWPSSGFAFGVHADQGIQTMAHPLVLVSLLRESEGFPTKGKIEGFVTPDYLRDCTVLSPGQKFPGSGVISRTTNIVTLIGDYKPLAQLVP
jgi:hypothetical protein